ncbi:MAG: (p)ppGpp synthetase [Lachnospiraceae bacterium]|nr:(p)ppGpp synthetase [Lachnospiraceae bacterium]
MTQEDYDSLIKPYEEALAFVNLRLNGMDQEYRSLSRNYPIHSMQQRIKSRSSIVRKLENKGRSVSKGSAGDCLTDIAGIRVIVYFEQDIYTVIRDLKKQPDVKVIKETDYVKNPKSNGYKSYHLVLNVPVYRMRETRFYPVEVQIRTLSMDLWASMEHRICYKNWRGDDVPDDVRNMLKLYANGLEKMEQDMYAQITNAGKPGS